MPVLNQVSDGDHRKPVLSSRTSAAPAPGPSCVIVHDFADDAGLIETSHPRQVHRRLSLPRTHQHAAVPATLSGDT
jgi:hypothetical protein